MSEKNKADNRQKLLDEFQSFIEGLEGMDETFQLLPWQKLVVKELLTGGGPEELAVRLARSHGRSVLYDALKRFERGE